MKCAIIIVVTFGVVAGSSPLALAQRGSPRNVILDPEAVRNGWILNLEEAQAQGRKSAKPLMVVLRCNP